MAKPVGGIINRTQLADNSDWRRKKKAAVRNRFKSNRLILKATRRLFSGGFMLTTPRAIVLGFSLIAAAIMFQPMTQNIFMAPAPVAAPVWKYPPDASLFNISGFLGQISEGIDKIAEGMSNLRACRG
jgi:hypothetical protein